MQRAVLSEVRLRYLSVRESSAFENTGLKLEVRGFWGTRFVALRALSPP
jgi:hypothetical protein